MRRRSAFLGVLVALAMSLVAYAPAQTASADFATDCGAPTRTLTGPSSASITVAPGERLLLTGGSFTGGIDAFPAGSNLCIAGSATLAPAYLNNAAGDLDVAPGGRASFPSISVATGFDLDNQGTVTFTGLNINGAASIRNLAGGTMTVNSQFSPGNGTIVNNGAFTAAAGINLNTPVSLRNTKTMTINGDSTVNGSFDNTGLVTATGSITVNGGASFSNRCALSTTAGLSNNATGSTNDGIVDVTGLFSNNGSWTQPTTGVVTSGSLSNDGNVSGFGRYGIRGDSRTQGSFAGTSASDPIVVDDQTPPTPPQIFNTQSGTVVNVVPGTIRALNVRTYPAPGCSDITRPGADVVTSKAAPPTVAAGGSLTFTITVTNSGPDPAQGVVVTDTLPPELSNPTASNAGVVSGGTVTWSLGTLATGATRELTVTGTAPASGTLVNQVASTATTQDPDPTNNDGTAESASTTTDVDPAPPPVNQPPVAEDLTVAGQSQSPVLSRVVATDPDAGQTLRFTGPTTGPANGRVVMLPSGGFAYLPDSGFAGRDSFDYEVCDNGEPSLCDTATVTLEISPVAIDDAAETAAGTAVSIPVASNDVPGGVVDSVGTGPANGTATLLPSGEIEYTPDPGFTGQDTFSYTYCAPDTAPPLCDTAQVTVNVLPVNNPPVVGSLTVDTTTDTSVSGTVVVSDPDAGQSVTLSRGIPPRSGTVVVNADGSFTYRPRAGSSGVDSFFVIGCDNGDPKLCSTGKVTVRVFPVAVDDGASTTAGDPVSIPVLGNDAGAMNEPPQITSQPASGSVRVDGKRIVYTPDPGFTGTDTFSYRICSPGSQPLCSEATVTVHVTAGSTPTPTPTPPSGGGSGGSGGGTSTSSPYTSTSSALGSLAETGGPAFILLVGGVVLVLLGVAFVLVQRRRR